jgi:hypothetical protein
MYFYLMLFCLWLALADMVMPPSLVHGYQHFEQTHIHNHSVGKKRQQVAAK